MSESVIRKGLKNCEERYSLSLMGILRKMLEVNMFKPMSVK